MAGNQVPAVATANGVRGVGRADVSESFASHRGHGAVGTWLRSAAERVSERIGTRQLALLRQRERVRRELRSVPERMQKLTNQTSLVLELVDDYGAGAYRAIPWRSLVVAAGALLYAVSPSDVVPDFLPLLGQLDDALVLGIALRVIRGDLERYCEFKGYDPAKYF